MGKTLMMNMLVASVTGALKVLEGLMNQTDFKRIMDQVLNAIEGYFEEESLMDLFAEGVTDMIRRRFEIEDSNPDN